MHGPLELDLASLAPAVGEQALIAMQEASEFEVRADLVLVVDRESQLIYASRGWSNLGAEPREVVIGQPVLEAIRALPLSQEELKTLEYSLAEAMRDQSSASVEFVMSDPVLGQRYLEGRVYGPRPDSGHLFVVFHERTLSMLGAVRLMEDERRFRMIAEAAHDMVTETNSSGLFTYVSPACSHVLGYSDAEMVGGAPLDLHHPDDLPGFLEQLKAERRPGVPFTVSPHRLRHADGHWLWVEATGVRYRRPDGELRTIGVARDISARREAESARHQLEEQVRRAQKLESLGILAGGIAHDFNNFLTPIVGTAGLLAAELADQPQLATLVDRIRKAARRATDLTSQMLTYAGQNEPKLERIDVSETIRDMALLLESTASHSARIEYALEGDLPAILADRAQIGQVVMNLVSNATEALGERSGTIQLRTGLLDASKRTLERYHLGNQMEPGWFVQLEVSDDGKGMDAETRDLIFDPFFSTKFTGRGLGLAVVLGIVKRHSGAIQIESEAGEGTRFRILVPVAQGAHVGEPKMRTLRPVPTHVVGQSGHVLVVDDDEGAREVACLMLERAGFDVHSASDGESALRLFREQSATFRSVVLDNTMPGLSGAQVFTALREIEPEIPVVLISGYTRERIADELLARSGVCFLSKPFTEEALVDAVHTLLDTPTT